MDNYYRAGEKKKYSIALDSEVTFPFFESLQKEHLGFIIEYLQCINYGITFKKEKRKHNFISTMILLSIYLFSYTAFFFFLESSHTICYSKYYD